MTLRHAARVVPMVAVTLALGLVTTCTPKPVPEPRPPRPEARSGASPRANTRRAPGRRVVKPSVPRPRPVVAWRAQPPAPGPAPAIVTPTVESRKLKNGLTVLLVRRPALPLTALRLVIRAGSYEDPVEKPGVAFMTADMLNEGVRGADALKLANRAGQIGATLHTHAGEDSSHLSIAVLSRHLRPALSLLADATLRPTFPQAELARRQGANSNIVARVLMYPSYVASIVFSRVLFGDKHPYGRLDMGRPAQIKAITRANLLAFYRMHYRPENAALVVVGNVTWRTLLPRVKRAFGRWKVTGSRTIHKYTAAPRAGRLFVVNRPGSAQSVVRMGEVGPARSHKDRVRLLVMNTILGGSFSSRINMSLREKHGFTYGAYSSFSFSRRPGSFTVRTSVKTAATAPALRELLGELRAMAGGKVTARELDLAKSYLSVSVSGWFVTNGGVAGAVSRLFVHQLPMDFYAKFPARVRGVTRADVARVAKRHLHPDKMKIVIVGDLAQRVPVKKGSKETATVGQMLRNLGLGAPKLLKP
jgi:zinc protease